MESQSIALLDISKGPSKGAAIATISATPVLTSRRAWSGLAGNDLGRCNIFGSGLEPDLAQPQRVADN